MPQGPAVVAIDLGTSKVCAVVAEGLTDGRTGILGVGLCPAQGMARGIVADLDEAAGAIRQAIERAERNSGYQALSAFVSVSGAHLFSANGRGVIVLPRERTEVTTADVAQVLEAATTRPSLAHNDILHILPRTYVLDGQTGVADPIGMTGSRLEVEAHVIGGAATAIRNVVRSVERAGVEIDDLVPEPLAAAEAVLTPAEREMGVALVDIGAGTTDLAVYVEHAVWHTAVLPIGGNHLTNDLSIVLQIPFESAEQAKLAWGRAMSEPGLPDAAAADDQVEVEGFEGSPRVISRRMAHEVLEARLEQILHLVSKELRESGYDGPLPGGLVLTGGTALLPEIAELTSQVLGMRARVGTPRRLAGLGDSLGGPAFAAGVGLAQWAIARQQLSVAARRAGRAPGRPGRRPRGTSWRGNLRTWLRELLP